ncbi:MAG: 6-phosphogluconolactonase [Acidobacteria bacterium]|nr:6-phosphogluconolactonase [Acidobacteriota bacterium]
MIVTILDDPEAVADAGAARIASCIEAAIAARGEAVVCLTGGPTPQRVYELLADDDRPWRARVDWRRVHVFWGDERHVPPDHADSNYGMASRALLSRVPVRADQIHRMRGELPDAAAAARDCDLALHRACAALGRHETTFDLELLGLGEDAHIASLFPGSPLLAVPPPDERVAAVHPEHLGAWRITLTPRALLDARVLIVLVAGSHKAHAVHAAFDLATDVGAWPVQLLRQSGERVEWIMDSAAAAQSPGAQRARSLSSR